MARRRWESETERLREAAPAWFDVERLPWWLLLLVGLLFLGIGVDSVVTGESTYQRVAGVGMLVMVGPAQLLMAYRRYRGIPLMTPARFGRRAGGE